MSLAPDHPVEQILRAVAAQSNLAADAALTTALPRMHPGYQVAAAEKVLARNNPSGLALMVGEYQRCASGLQRFLIDHIGQLYQASRRCIGSDRLEHRLGVIALIRTSGETKLAYLLCAALTGRCPKTRTAAAETIAAMTEAVVGERAGVMDDPNPDAERRAREMAEALSGALDSWAAHFRPEVIRSAMMLCDLTAPRLIGRLGSNRSHLGRALNEAMLSGDAAMAPYAMHALVEPSLRAVATREIGRQRSVAFATGLLDQCWVTVLPEHAKSCAWIRRLDWILEHRQWVCALEGVRARWAARLVGLSGLSAETKMTVFRTMLSSGTPDVRDAALWQVIGLDTAAAEETLERVAESGREPAATLACNELFRRRRSIEPRKARKPARAIAQIQAEGWSGDDAFDDFWRSLPDRTEMQQLLEAQKLRAEWPGFDAIIETKLLSDAQEDQLRALRIVQILDAADDFERSICQLAHSPDDRVRESATRVLGEIESVTALRMLRRALSDENMRVQANAVEAVAERDLADQMATLLPKLDSGHQRVRANAVKALLVRRQRDAAVALVRMLEHESGAMRLSALWVVETLGLTVLHARARKMATDDPDEDVRRRAARIVGPDSAVSSAAEAPEAEAAEASPLGSEASGP